MLVNRARAGQKGARFPMKIHTTLKLAVAALALAFSPDLHAQAPASGASKSKAQAKAPEQAPEAKVDSQAADLGKTNITITYEAFSLPIAKAAELQRKGLSDEELYKEFLSVGKLERLLVLRTESGKRAVVESVSEYKFPTEFTPPQAVQHPVPPPQPVPLPVAPTAFDKRDLGDTLDAEPTLSEDAKSVDFQIVVIHSALAKREKWGKDITELEQPQLETRKLSTNLSVPVNAPHLIGTLNPVYGNGLAERAEQHVWFCFITATVAQNKAPAPTKSAR